MNTYHFFLFLFVQGGEYDNIDVEEDKDDGAWVAESKKKKTPPKDSQSTHSKKAGSANIQKFLKVSHRS